MGCVSYGIVMPEAHAQNKKSYKDLSSDEKETFNLFVDAAKAAYKEKRYDSALRKLEQAYLVAPEPGLLYRIAECHEMLGQTTKAIEVYEQYLEEVPDYKKREQLEARIAELEQIKETTLVVRTSPKEARVLVDGEFLGLSPQTINTARDTVKIQVEAEGYVALSQDVVLEPGVQKELLLALQLDHTQTQPSDAMTGKQKAGIGMMAGGGAVLIGGGVFTFIGTQTRNELDALDRNAPRPNDFNERYDRANARTNIGLGLMGAGLAITGAGAWLFFASGEESSASLELRPLLSPSHQGVSATLTF